MPLPTTYLRKEVITIMDMDKVINYTTVVIIVLFVVYLIKYIKNKKK